MTEGVLDVLDHSAPHPLFGGKLGIDATERFEGEPTRRLCDDNQPERRGHSGGDQGIEGCGLLQIGRPAHQEPGGSGECEEEGLSSKLIREMFRPIASSSDASVLYDDIDLKDSSLVLWKAFNNVDPLRDIESVRNGVIIDATKKGLADGHPREWPDEIEMSKDVKERIELRKRVGLG